MEDKFKNLYEAIVNGDSEKAKHIAEEIAREKVDPIRVIDEVIRPAAKLVGEKFERCELFLPELMASADAIKIATNILLSAYPKKFEKIAKVVIATVKGDIHDIGKNIVKVMLEANGFEVYDLGVDVPAPKIIEKAEEVGADIIALSALLTTTMLEQREVIRILNELGLRSKYLVIVGGGPVTKEWAEEIGAVMFAHMWLLCVVIGKVSKGWWGLCHPEPNSWWSCRVHY